MTPYDLGFRSVLPLYRVDAKGKPCGDGYIPANKECRAGKGKGKASLNVPDKEYDRMGDEYAEALNDVQRGFGGFDAKKQKRYEKAWKALEAESRRRGENPALVRLKYMNKRRSIAKRVLVGN